ncbi:hypothetical protein [Streptomyces sp. NPDC050988]|uniref:hypothetical protein n=1 Tax=Streptomyces sp. NPDC050988 TaxID=3365637 RepID=UPI0037B7B2C8
MEIKAEPSADEVVEPPLGEQLLALAGSLGEEVAVWALATEEQILSRSTVRKALVYSNLDGTLGLAWERLDSRFYELGLDEAALAFLDLVLSVAGIAHRTSLVRVMDLDERRTAIILRTMIRLSGCDTLAVGTRT